MSVILNRVRITNPADKFNSQIQFDIEFESLENLQHDLEFTVKFLDSKPEDITLDSIAVGPVQMGKSQFFLEVDGPSVEQIARDDLLDVTALVLVCSYCGAEFERVGFFVFHYYDDEAMRAQPPEVPAVTHLMREIKVDDIRHTNFTIDWDTPGSAQKQVEELLSSIASSSHDAPPLSQPPLSSHHSSFAPPLSLPSAVDGR